MDLSRSQLQNGIDETPRHYPDRTRRSWAEAELRRAARRERLRQHLLFVADPRATDIDAMLGDLDAGITAWPQGFETDWTYTEGK
jgi:hypothetical protein